MPGRFTPADGSPVSYARLLLVLPEEHDAERRAHEDLDGAQGVTDTVVVVVDGGEGGRATSGGTAPGRA